MVLRSGTRFSETTTLNAVSSNLVAAGQKLGAGPDSLRRDISDGGRRLALAELGARGEYLVEPVGTQGLADPVRQFVFAAPQHRPGPQPGPPSQAVGRPSGKRRALGVALGQGQPGERDKAQRDVAADPDGQAQV